MGSWLRAFALRVRAWMSLQSVRAGLVQIAGLLVACAGVAGAFSVWTALIVGGVGVVLFGVAYEKGS